MEPGLRNGGSGQLQAIHAMLATGHASIRLERHTFMLWGLAAACLILLVPRLFSQGLFPDHELRMWLQNLFVSAVLLATGVVDAIWTARARSRRDESLSFTQRQLTRLWWLLIALVVVINVGMNLYGGGYFFYGIVLVLTGIGIYVQGLFSRQLLTWSGALQIVLGLVLVAFPPKLQLQEWIAASAFGIGFPAFAFMVDRTRGRNPLKELLLSLGWLALVLVPAFCLAILWPGERFDDWRRLSWEGYRDADDAIQEEDVVVTLPAGTRVPVTVRIEGDLLRSLSPPQPLVMVTTRPLDLPIEKGEVIGKLRIGEGEWRSAYDYRITGWNPSARLSPQDGPSIDLGFQLNFMR